MYPLRDKYRGKNSGLSRSFRDRWRVCQHQLASRGAVMIFTRSRNAATGDNWMYCMIPDPFPGTAFGKGSATQTTRSLGNGIVNN